MKAEIWSRAHDLRPSMPLILRRVKNYTANGTGRESFSTELLCCGKSFTIAPCQNEANAEWLLRGWIKQLDPIFAKYELQNHVMRPTAITDAEDFARAIICSNEYIDKHKENNESSNDRQH